MDLRSVVPRTLAACARSSEIDDDDDDDDEREFFVRRVAKRRISESDKSKWNTVPLEWTPASVLPFTMVLHGR